MKFSNKINILNKKARFHYEIMDKYEAGIQLFGTEIKSIRLGKANISEGFCQFIKNELYIINMQIEEYGLGTHYNHMPKRDRKLLLKSREIKNLHKQLQNIGLTIVPLRLFINDRGFAKLEIALARGKKIYDKRESIKERDVKKNLARLKKRY